MQHKCSSATSLGKRKEKEGANVREVGDIPPTQEIRPEMVEHNCHGVRAYLSAAFVESELLFLKIVRGKYSKQKEWNTDLEEERWTRVSADIVKGLIHVVPKHDAGDDAAEAVCCVRLPTMNDQSREEVSSTVGYDCGLFVLTFKELLSMNIGGLYFEQRDMRYMKDKCLLSLLQGKISQFPNALQDEMLPPSSSVNGLTAHTYMSSPLAAVQPNSASTLQCLKSWTESCMTFIVVQRTPSSGCCLEFQSTRVKMCAYTFRIVEALHECHFGQTCAP
ncbi:hypothetical protein Cgig2_030224 [Carnegiea gigantea]|uniref:Ubiquitin-like protease family profile domain-containing protein n=1 Tax=Carnegiea gigantea TaxID=171969 RepID=A0A9Q1JG97_9CARY|nr:hypothetical protein Cgig2_030224 [Carnegiea gigantea]